MARGDVRGAAATLERILLVNPDLAAIRLFYAIVLYRLDNLEEAEREFREILKLDVTPGVRAEVEGFLDAIALRRKDVVYTARLSIGLKYDTNVNAGPRRDQAQVLGVPVRLLGRATEQRDVAILGLGSIDAVHDLGLPEGHELTFGASYFLNEQFSIDSQDVGAGTARLGFNLRFDDFDLKPRATYTTLDLSKEKFFTGVSLGARLEQQNVIPAWGTDGYLDAFWSQESFHNILEDPTARFRSGSRVEVAGGLSHKVDRRNLVGGQLSFIRKRARQNHDEYNGLRAEANHTYLFGGGSFLLSGVSVERRLYRAPEVAVTPNETRDEWEVRLRTTYGMPLAAVLNEDHFVGTGAAYYSFLKDVTWTATLEYTDQDSSINNFTYDNFRAQTMLTKNWRF